MIEGLRPLRVPGKAREATLVWQESPAQLRKEKVKVLALQLYRNTDS